MSTINVVPAEIHIPLVMVCAGIKKKKTHFLVTWIKQVHSVLFSGIQDCCQAQHS